jgi:hypothetical protein
MIENLNALDVHELAINAIMSTEGAMVQLNREQLSEGLDSKGHKLKPTYGSKAYATKKAAQNPRPGKLNPDLILTGDFVESFKVSLSGDVLKFEAGDIKAPDLLEKYGDDVMGLMDTQQDHYNHEVFYPEFAGNIEHETGLKFE